MSTNVRLRRILSVVLSLCMIVSWNVPTYAAAVDGTGSAGNTGSADKTYEYTPDTCPKHEYTELHDTMQEPTCTEDGIGIYACGKCGYVDDYDGVGAIPALGHDEQVERNEATCTEDGSIVTTCSRCDYRDEQPIPATGQHDFDESEKVEASAATCTENKKIGYKCKNCPEFDESSLEEVADTALGHDFSGDPVQVRAATCSAYAMKAATCVHEGCDATDRNVSNWTEDEDGGYDDTKHNFEGADDELLEAATCEAAAVWGKKCVDCQTAVDEDSKHSVGDPNADAHDVDGVATTHVAATCAHGSYDVQICKLCGEEVKTNEDSDLDPENHEYADTLSVISAATCHTGEVKAKRCTNPDCDAYDENSKVIGNELDEDNHEWGQEKTLPADCKGNARVVKVCPYHEDAEQLVKDLYEESVEAGEEDVSLKSKGHAEKILPAVPATCKTPGKTEGKVCLVCGETLQKQEVVPVDENAHAFPEEANEIFKEETCSKTGLGKYICTEEGCGTVEYKVIPARHIYEEVVTKAATCTEAGEKVMTCAREGGCTNASADDYTKTEAIKALGHDWGDGEVTTPATCTKEGVRTYTCTHECGETQTAAEPMIAHDYQTDVIPADCQHPAQTGSACTVCGAIEPNTTPTDIQVGEEDYEAQKSHDYQVDAELSEEASCTEDGKTVKVCSMCGDTQEEVVTASGHTYETDTNGDDVITEEPATCTAASYFTKHCTVCEQDIAMTSEEAAAAGKTPTPATNHEGTTVEKEKIPATCQKVGHEAGTYCTACETYTDGGEEIAIDTTDAGHDWKITPLKEATCTTNGIGKYECQNEGCEEVKHAVIPAAHTWAKEGTVTKAATCEEDGEKTFACTKCEETKTETIDALGHDWNEWQVDEDSNCGKTGTKTRTCTRDAEHVEEEVIPIKGEHQEEYGVIPADCTNPARAGAHCTVCGQAIGDTVVINEANKAEIVAAYKTSVEYPSDESTATQDQQDALAAFEESLVEKAALDHDTTETTVTEPTCTEAGTTKITCSRCDYEASGTIKKLGHEIEDEYVEATCTENGKTTPVCKRKGCDYRGDTVDLGDLDPAIGHDLEADNETALKKATCTTTGIGKLVCSHKGCDYSEYGVIPITHTYDQGVEETKATCTTDGEKVYTCSECTEETEGHTKSEVIPATGHSYGAKEFVAATCTTPASVGKKCEHCGQLEAGATVITAENKTALLNELKAGLDDVADADKIGELTAQVVPAEATGHDWENDSSIQPESETAATCYAAGEKVYVCELCETETKVVVPKREHNYKETYHEATCTEAGYLETTCTQPDCEYSEIDRETFADIDPALDHDLEDVAQKDATCVEAGHASGQRCKREGCDYVVGCEEIQPDTTNGHVWDDGVEQGDDICNNGGTLLKTCTLCSTATKEESIEPGHKWERQTLTNEETGKTMAIVKGCAREGCNVIAEYLYMPKGYGYCPTHGLVEVPDEYVIPAVEATCTSTGMTEGRRCPQCPDEAEPILQPQEVPMKDHTFKEEKIIEPAKCNAAGSKAKVCDVCNNTYDEEVIPATGIHEYKDVLVDATCATNAIVKHLCTGCNQPDPDNAEEEIPDTIDENAHIYDGTECTHCHKPMPADYAHCEEHGWVKGEVVEGTESTCTATGLTDGIKCSVCKEWITEQEEKPLADHVYTKWVTVTEATCKDAGEEKQVCVNCDAESGETREIPKTTVHDWDEVTTVATCMTPDKIVMVCTVCGEEGDTVYQGTDVDPDGHEFEDGVCKYCHKSAEELGGYVECPTDGWVKGQFVRGKAPTCIESGLSDGIKCPVCKEWITEQTVLDPTGEHTFGEWVELEAPTCKDAGKKVAKCSVCEQQYGDEEEIPATGEHSYTDEGLIDATCTTNAYVTYSCSVCGEEDESLRKEVPDSKLGHNFVDGVCGNCGASDVKIATAGNPTIIDGNYKVTMRSDIDVADEDMEIVEIGVLYITSRAYAGNAKEDMSFTVNEQDGTYSIANASVKAQKETVNPADYDYVYVNINLGATEANHTRTLYGRGYVIVKKDGKYSVQFDDNVVQGTYADGFTAQ